ncbi:hypothetical protein EV189_0152 [Motilibacter rhizosphaerae]|uniref:Uncharacterized protein n=1 Tax=Motilibacter rhizosphaerae TaxID=598652 RepID=A0A4Q7NWZ3_9ACTN|nr:hypothetical protein [Motilibacter rhizosphaerae]RZS90922.1 hypothetical protein EV189_0152 [Motilibacter rhizosphaerae]
MLVMLALIVLVALLAARFGADSREPRQWRDGTDWSARPRR